MKDPSIKSAPEPTLRRLPIYYNYLKRLVKQGRNVVSCSHIGRDLDLDPPQIRKDLAVTGIVGMPKVGYELLKLIEAIETFLGWNNVNEAFLVGDGSFGTALLGFDRSNTYGLHIVAAFDNAPDKIGQEVHGRSVLPLEKLPDLADRMHALVGIIAVPAESAQSVADVMVASGIRAVWNLAPVHIEVPKGIIVQREDLFASLAVLTSKLCAALQDDLKQNP